MTTEQNGFIRVPQEIFFDGKQWPPNFTPEKVRSAKAMKPRSDDIFICTYPKSGTTWMQHIVHQLMGIAGKPEYNVNNGEEEKKSMFFASPLIERFGAAYTEEMDSPRILKSHLTYSEIPKGGGAKYIYACRNPKDALTSYYNHFINFKHYHFENGDFSVYFNLYMKGMVGLGDYFDHFTSWLKAIENKDEQILLLKYEDMVADLRSAVIKIASFLGRTAAELISDEEELNRIVEASSLASMKKDQNRWFPDGMTYSKDVFVRKGGSRDWKNFFSHEQSQIMDKRFHERCAGTIAVDWWKKEMAWEGEEASIAEMCMCFSYLLLIMMIATTRVSALKTPFYFIFVVTAIAALSNLVVIIILRLFNQVFFFGPEFGTICNWLSYFSHVLVFTQTTMKAMQVTNRFTALFFPLKHDDIWASRIIWLIVIASYCVPAGAFSFMIINQPALYSDAGGRLKYAGIERSAQELAKLISAADQVVFVIVTLPMNVMLLLKMRRLRKENLTQFQKERMYLYYVLVITVAHMIKGAHQVFWLIATTTQNISWNFIATYTYAYPNTITTFTPPITLILMSKQVRNGIQLFLCNRHSGSNVVDSAYSHRVTTLTPM